MRSFWECKVTVNHISSKPFGSFCASWWMAIPCMQNTAIPPPCRFLSLRQHMVYPGITMLSAPSCTVSSRNVSTAMTMVGSLVLHRLASSPMFVLRPRMLTSIIRSSLSRSRWTGRGRFRRDLSFGGFSLFSVAIGCWLQGLLARLF